MGYSFQWDKKQEGFAKEVGDEHQVLTSQVKQAVEIVMRGFVTRMRELSPCTVPNFGRFFLSPWKTNRLILNLFKAERAGTITKDELREKIRIYWPIHQTAIKHFPRTGIKYKIERLKAQGIYEGGNRVKLFLANKGREAKHSEEPESLSEGKADIQSECLESREGEVG